MSAEPAPSRRELSQPDPDSPETVEDISDVPAEIMEQLPPEARRVVEMSLSMMHRVSHAPNPVLGKVTSEHITAVLELSDKDGHCEFQSTLHSRLFTAFYVLVFVGLFVFLTLELAPLDKALYMDVVKIVLAFAGGFGSGFGVKSLIDRRRG